MSAFGTKKPGGDEAVQLTFPAEFSRAYKKERLAARYAPSGPVVPVQVYAGDDFQARIHRERKAESDRRVMNGVKDTKMAEQRYLLSHQGYYNLPKVVLSQRKMGSNFGVGGGWNSSYAEKPLVGGVIASTEGREWVKESLRRRKAELDALDSNQFDMPLSRAVSKGEPPASFTTLARVELVSFLDQLYAQATTGKFEFSPETFRRFFALLIRFATECQKEEFDDVYQGVTDVYEVMLARLGGRFREQEEDPLNADPASWELFLSAALKATLAYLDLMAKGINRQPKERITLSKSSVVSSGLTNLNRESARFGVSAVVPPLEDMDQFLDLPDFAFLPENSTESGPGYPPLPPSVSSMGSTQESSTDSGQTFRGYNSYFNPLLARSQERQQQATATSSRYSGRLAQSRFTANPQSSEVSSGPAWISTSNAGWSNTPRDQFGRQGVSELRGVRRYADEEEGEDLAQQQAGEDYEAITEEAGFQRSLANLRQSNIGEEEQDSTGAVTGPPEGEYFDTWVSKGYNMPSQLSADLLQARLQGRDGIDSFLSGFSGQRDVAAVRRLVNDLRKAKNPQARNIESDDIYQVKKTLRPLLVELFE